MSAALAKLRATREKVEGRGISNESYSLRVSNCCEALFLTWGSGDGDLELSCTRCGEVCAMVEFDALADPRGPTVDPTRSEVGEAA